MGIWLSYGVYIAIGAVFVVLAFGDREPGAHRRPNPRSRSNKLMRLRVLVQFIAIILLGRPWRCRRRFPLEPVAFPPR
jgi:hypothetical protein